jgi:hypothetical protein
MNCLSQTQVLAIVGELLDRGFNIGDRPFAAEKGSVDLKERVRVLLQVAELAPVIHSPLTARPQHGQHAGRGQLCEAQALGIADRNLQPDFETGVEVGADRFASRPVALGRQIAIREPKRFLFISAITGTVRRKFF